MKRTVTCGDLRKADEGKTVVLNGWVHRKRDHGGISFINLRDRYGITQVVVDEDSSSELLSATGELKMEYCIAVEGRVRARPDTMINPAMPTGEVEVVAVKLEILSRSEVPPFVIDEKTNASEELRLKYRYLDLRSQQMQRHLALRSKVTYAVRQYLTGLNFYEIETPTFIKSTPEGARDYLVPSRLYPGQFYALPQSPQLYKQLLMVSGFDRYFQIARCYRDEDARGDRQPEFTQIDLEMSFVSRDDVLSLIEGMMGYVFRETLGKELPSEFRRISFDDAMNLYGSDKPELRFEMQMQDGAFLAELGTFQAFRDALSGGGKIKCLVVPGAAEKYSRKMIEDLEGTAKIYKAKGLGWMKASAGENGVSLEGGISKFFEGKAPEICEALGAKAGDLLLFVADSNGTAACTALGAVRTRLGRDLNLCDPSAFAFAWIVDFPMFEWNEEENKWDTAHHMFTMPQEKYLDTLESDPGSVKGDLYDLVLNGYELASGSIRIHDPELQKRVFKIVGFSEEEGQKKFGFLTEAFRYGAPPHGGIAPGLDRLVMLMSGETSIKEVIAFPKNSFAQSPMDDCPSPVDQQQLDELHIKIIE
ncbi:aspartate--tRNA ligase [Brucepastera parasyntrophica]|uniref:aspartate--tRNA ligase n=1 Tax=Brucepastera parasyntrophica TaxID=2880008 RepID=UPI00210B68FD|nr:aspartate--tRNA ligase [Brucepastera parasyntrophica]ULQ58585.1 aspartate--tRNA ligase [Brucepastera parasyntrophica]